MHLIFFLQRSLDSLDRHVMNRGASSQGERLGDWKYSSTDCLSFSRSVSCRTTNVLRDISGTTEVLRDGSSQFFSAGFIPPVRDCFHCLRYHWCLRLTCRCTVKKIQSEGGRGGETKHERGINNNPPPSQPGEPEIRGTHIKAEWKWNSQQKLRMQNKKIMPPQW